MKWIASLVLLMASAVTAQAQDPQEGAKSATNVCSECHATRTGQIRSPNGRAPTFAELAKHSGYDECGIDRGNDYTTCRHADVRPNLRAAARYHCLHSEPEGQ